MTALRSLVMLQGLAKLLADNAPQSFKESKFENYFGRKIAVDASMHMYQFLVSLFRPTREHSENGLSLPALCCSCCACGLSCGCIQAVVGRTGDQLLTSEAGEVTRCS